MRPPEERQDPEEAPRQGQPAEGPVADDDAPHPHGHPKGLERAEAALDEVAHRILAPVEQEGRPGWLLPAVKFGLPLALMTLGIALLPLLFPGDVPEVYIFLTTYFLIPGGLETAIPIGLGVLDLHAFLLLGLILYVTMAGTLFMVWNLEHLGRVPWLGRRLEKLEAKAQRAYRKRPWMERSAFWGVAAFVVLPLNGTGAVPGTILGKLLGLHKGLQWLAVVLGSTVRASLWTLLSLGVLKAFF